METRFEFSEDGNVCVIYLANDMCEEESSAVLNYTEGDEMIRGCNKYIVVVPEPFGACEDFRIQIHRLIRSNRKSNPNFRIAIVTTLLNVIGYEQFAKTVIGMVEREQIFDTLDEAIEWLKNE